MIAVVIPQLRLVYSILSWFAYLNQSQFHAVVLLPTDTVPDP